MIVVKFYCFKKSSLRKQRKYNVKVLERAGFVVLSKLTWSLLQKSVKVQTCTYEIMMSDCIIPLKLNSTFFSCIFFRFGLTLSLLCARLYYFIFYRKKQNFSSLVIAEAQMRKPQFLKPKGWISSLFRRGWSNTAQIKEVTLAVLFFNAKWKFGDNINNFNMKGGKSSYKYSKVNQQKKFHLLTLVLHQKLLIKQAARIVGINYSTAKTIMFFNRNHNKSYQFSFHNPHNPTHQHHQPHASYKQLPHNIIQDPNADLQPFRIAIFNSIGNQKVACRSMTHHMPSSADFTKRMRDDSNDLSQDYIDEEKRFENVKLQRPRTRSQSVLFKPLFNSKQEENQKRDYQSSDIPEIAEYDEINSFYIRGSL